MASAITFRIYALRRMSLYTTTATSTRIARVESPLFQKLIEDLRCCREVAQVSRIHGYMVKTGIDKDDFTVSKLIASSSLQDIRYASSIFENVSNTNLFMFNTMLRGYSISDDPERAFPVFNQLRAEFSTLDRFSFIPTLKSCARELCSRFGEGVHGIVLRSGFIPFTDLRNALLRFYCVSGRINDARKLFDEMLDTVDAISFTTLMNGYLQVSKPALALYLFTDMRRSDIIVNDSTLLSFLSATGMYGKIGDMSSARRIFDSAASKDVVIWNCMIDQYAKMGLLEECLWLLRQMKYEQVKPNSSTFVGLLSSCASYEASSVGQSVGDLVEEERVVLDAVLGTALVDMYAKLGMLDKAVEIFNRMKNKDVKSWTAMISGYGAHGLAREAINIFYKMEDESIKVKPNKITFLVVLNACSHGGLVMEGITCFKRMVEVYRFIPEVEHYGCVVDLLGRAGQLEEAYELIKNLPITSDSTAWRALLAACRVYGNVDLGGLVRTKLVEMGERNFADAVLLAGTHAVAGNPQGRQYLLDNELYKEKKEAGYSAIEIEWRTEATCGLRIYSPVLER
ncbi:pentatricopeptide repeat-containing protein At1g26900, mitochondrial isoform X2 [Raphanus sativus]|uniref:Pentatricopeptide repeat-containing protein At1g26900, mitochondrial isoform X2 n=1 Tax=Raphanus sativus TaxID=3726 RepID=A0A9W3BUU0_RAPSA|nr:pentatricopeptide repeat-containing protein At1g26900, mitochondrial isoform X2 [Raphanus sativus]